MGKAERTTASRVGTNEEDGGRTRWWKQRRRVNANGSTRRVTSGVRRRVGRLHLKRKMFFIIMVRAYLHDHDHGKFGIERKES